MHTYTHMHTHTHQLYAEAGMLYEMVGQGHLSVYQEYELVCTV